MTQLFINSFLNQNYGALYQKFELIVILWIIVLAAIIIDLISGLYKSHQIGEPQTSFGFRRTVGKAIQYFGLMSFALMFDVLISLAISTSYISILCCFFLVFIEAKSVLEKAQEKDRRRMQKSIKDLITLIENKDNILKGIDKIITNNTQKESKDAD